MLTEDKSVGEEEREKERMRRARGSEWSKMASMKQEARTIKTMNKKTWIHDT